MSSLTNFSVLMSVYEKDDPHLLSRALNSISANSVRPIKLVLVGDGNLTEDLYKIISQFHAVPLIFLPLSVNGGLARALNFGLNYIDSDYVIRADADDFNYPNRFELIVAKLSEGFDVVGSSIREVDKNGLEVAFRICPLTEPEIRNYIKRRNPFNHMTIGFRTSIVQSVGGYPNIYLKEDYALWALLLSRGARVCNLSEVLVDATAGIDMFKRRGGLKYAAAEIYLQSHLVRCGIKSRLSGFADGFFRSSIFLAPSFFRKFIYLRFLRERVQ